MGSHLSKITKKWKDQNTNPDQNARYEFSSPTAAKYFTEFLPLHKAALKGDWDAAKNLLDNDESLATARITEGGETALHVAAIEGHQSFVANLLNMINEPRHLQIQNANGSTALCFAAAGGHVAIAKLMVEKNKDLPTICGENRLTPLYMAALRGDNEMAEYLFTLSDFESWTEEHKIAFLTTCIDSGLYGMAMIIVDKCKTLALTEDCNGETPLEVLARKPLAFRRNNRQGFWGRILDTILSFKKLMTHNMPAPCDAYMLLDRLWDSIICQVDIEAIGNTSKLLFIAAEFGNDDFLVELIRRYPDFLYKIDEANHSIFHIAVLHRYVKVFNLMYGLGGFKDQIASYIDKDGNNILHLAAKLAPQNQLNDIPGAALQMQREVLWYKEVEKLVQPSYKIMKNSEGQTPHQLFLLEHENLMKEGEKVMKQIAKSCMLMTMLIATVVFTSSFTVPGGYNKTGAPILQNDKLFLVFPISEATATMSSLISMLMFLSILTSRFSDNDFVTSLPSCLVIGMVALFLSITAMMVVFWTCFVFYQHGLAAKIFPLVLFACAPMIFVFLKYPFLAEILSCGCKRLFRSNNRLFS